MHTADPVDVPRESDPVEVPISLRRPEEADLSPRLNNRPIFHGRRFTAEANVGGRTYLAEWPHEPEPPPMSDAEEMRARALERYERKRDDPDLIDI